MCTETPSPKLGTISDQKEQILLEEYKLIKVEATGFLSKQFTVLGIQLALIGVLITALVSCYSAIGAENVNDDNMFFVITFILLICIPGVTAVFGMILLDLTYRIKRHSFYMYRIEEELEKWSHDDEHSPGECIGLEHYLIQEQSQEFLPVGYLLYCWILGIMIVVPVIAFVLSFIIDVQINWQAYIIFFVITFLEIIFSVIYIRSILRYANNEKHASYKSWLKMKFEKTRNHLDKKS